jgi:transcriptional regulator with XRE-family HTH domain
MLLRLLFVKQIRNYNSYIKPIGGRKMLVLDMREIGNKLLTIRKRMGMTQVEVAEAAGLSSRTYADIERGTVNMRVETILRICDALHITPDEVLTKSECELTAQQEEIFSRLNACSPKDRETALRLLSVYLQSLSE